MQTPECWQVTTTTDSRAAAEGLARGAVTARAAACAQIVGPINSVYWWQGTVESAEEWMVLLKTTADRYQALEEYIRAHHSYDVPEIVATPIVGGSADYLAWVRTETRPAEA